LVRVGIAVEVSQEVRYSVDHGAVRRSLMILFDLLADEDNERDQFMGQIRADVRVPVEYEVSRHWEQRAVAGVLMPSASLEQLIREILLMFEEWMEAELESWMASIYPTLDPRIWLGSGEASGVVDVSLVADAIGLIVWVWNSIFKSPHSGDSM
jgi:hypothetical protein